MRGSSWLVGMVGAPILAGVVSLQAEDKIYLRGGGQSVIGIIEKVDDTTIFVKITQGSIPIMRVNIEKVEITKPDALMVGLKAIEAGKAVEAVQALEPIYIRYRGLPEPWIEEVTARLGESYLAAKEWTKARGLFVGLRKFYPKSDFRDLTTSGEAQALYGLSQPEEAVKLLEGLLVEREKEVSLNDEQNRALGKACVTLGRCYLSAKKDEQALETFLKTIVLYYLDDNAAAEAQYESALLFEKMNNPARAKGQLAELLKEFPNSPLAAEAKKKLDSLNAVP